MDKENLIYLNHNKINKKQTNNMHCKTKQEAVQRMKEIQQELADLVDEFKNLVYAYVPVKIPYFEVYEYAQLTKAIGLVNHSTNDKGLGRYIVTCEAGKEKRDNMYRKTKQEAVQRMKEIQQKMYDLANEFKGLVCKYIPTMVPCFDLYEYFNLTTAIGFGNQSTCYSGLGQYITACEESDEEYDEDEFDFNDEENDDDYFYNDDE